MNIFQLSALAILAIPGLAAPLDTSRFCSPQAIQKLQNLYQNKQTAQEFGLDLFLKRSSDAAKHASSSVMTKTMVPPSGDKHDYMSISKYYWPDPKMADGLPWIKKDGQSNENRAKLAPDGKDLENLSFQVRTASLAYAITGDRTYSKAAANWIRTWFLDDKTRMNPNLNFAEAVPGRSVGSATGIIDGIRLTMILDSLPYLKASPDWSVKDTAALEEWMRSYYQWLKKSPSGKEISTHKNNIRSWYEVQLASIAAYFGDQKGIAETLAVAHQELFPHQIQPDGSEPEELARTRPLQYSTFNLDALTRLASLEKNSSLWSDIGRAIDYLKPCYERSPSCPFHAEPWEGDTGNKMVDPFSPDYALRVLRRANQALPNRPYSSLIESVEKKMPFPKLDAFTLCLPDFPSSASSSLTSVGGTFSDVPNSGAQ